MQRFFGPLAFGDVHYCADVFSEIAGWTENRMPYCVDVPDVASGMKDSVIEFEPRLFAACSFELFHRPGLIIRVNTLKECLESRHISVRFETEDAVAFLGPIRDLSRSRSACPTACVAEPLRFRQISLTSL